MNGQEGANAGEVKRVALVYGEPAASATGESAEERPMTEEEWLTPGDLKGHVDYLVSKKRARKLRLFGIACCRQLEPWIDEPKLFDALTRAEQFADGELAASTLASWWRKVSDLEANRKQAKKKQVPQLETYGYVKYTCFGEEYVCYTLIWRVLVYHGAPFGKAFVRRGPQLAHALLLDIFGNPFRPMALSPSWRTDTAVALARQMYESRDFAAMPILADALQDAGCDNEDILSHCRDEKQGHVRGCWVVDLVLGKE
jgi:hypothetical protein